MANDAQTTYPEFPWENKGFERDLAEAFKTSNSQDAFWRKLCRAWNKAEHDRLTRELNRSGYLNPDRTRSDRSGR